MERFVSGDVVIVEFPFSDLSATKKRPALVVQELQGADVLLVQITHKSHYPAEEIKMLQTDIKNGKLKQESYLRYTKLFTIDRSLIQYRAGTVTLPKLQAIKQKIAQFILS